MAKRLVAKVGSYQKDGQEKGEYVRLGVILSNENGEYALLDPAVNLAGVLMKQRLHAQVTGRQAGNMIAVSIFEDQPQGRSGGHQQQAPQQQQGQHPQQQGGYQNNGFDDDIPF